MLHEDAREASEILRRWQKEIAAARTTSLQVAHLAADRPDKLRAVLLWRQA